MRVECAQFRNMVFHKKTVVAAMAVLVMIIWVQFPGHVLSSSDDCRMVSSVLESCYTSLQSGTFFMKAERICCRSLENLENRIQDHQLTRYAICECLKASDNDKQVLLNENLLEIQALCGPHVPHPITSYSDCLHYITIEKMNAIAAL